MVGFNRIQVTKIAALCYVFASLDIVSVIIELIIDDQQYSFIVTESSLCTNEFAI